MKISATLKPAVAAALQDYMNEISDTWTTKSEIVNEALELYLSLEALGERDDGKYEEIKTLLIPQLKMKKEPVNVN